MFFSEPSVELPLLSVAFRIFPFELYRPSVPLQDDKSFNFRCSSKVSWGISQSMCVTVVCPPCPSYAMPEQSLFQEGKGCPSSCPGIQPRLGRFLDTPVITNTVVCEMKACSFCLPHDVWSAVPIRFGSGWGCQRWPKRHRIRRQ